MDWTTETQDISSCIVGTKRIRGEWGTKIWECHCTSFRRVPMASGSGTKEVAKKIGGTPQPGWNRPSSKPAGLGRADQGKYPTHRTNLTSGKGIDYRNMKNTGTTRKNGGQITNQRGLMDLCWEISFGVGGRNRGACRYNRRPTTMRRNHLLASAQSTGNGMRTE